MKKVKIGDRVAHIAEIVSYTWLHSHCPSCDVKNWIYLGNQDDLTAPDADAFSCYACKRIFLLPFAIDDEIELEHLMEVGDFFLVDGQKNPN